MEPSPGTQETAVPEKAVESTSWKDTLSLFKITGEYMYTPVIIGINVLIWVAMVLTGIDPFEPSVESLINWGGNFSALTLTGQPWRLLTSTFLHGGILHLLFNMYALLQVGHILEIHFGKHRYALVYLVTGILASISSMAYSPDVVSVGASGAIFGLYGLLVTLLLTKSLKISSEERKALLASTLTFIGYNVVFGFTKSGIDNAAHIGGLLSGFITGFLYYPVIRKQMDSVFVSAFLVVFLGFAIWLAPRLLSNSYVEYESAIKKFTATERSAMWMFGIEFPRSGTEEATRFRERLKTQGVDLWKDNLALLNSLDNMPLPLEERIDLLKKYCQFRIEQCEIMQVVVDDEHSEQRNRLEEINAEVDKLFESLKELND